MNSEILTKNGATDQTEMDFEHLEVITSSKFVEFFKDELGKYKIVNVVVRKNKDQDYTIKYHVTDGYNSPVEIVGYFTWYVFGDEKKEFMWHRNMPLSLAEELITDFVGR